MATTMSRYAEHCTPAVGLVACLCTATRTMCNSPPTRPTGGTLIRSHSPGAMATSMLVAPLTTRSIVPRPVCTCTFAVLTTRRAISQGPLLSAIFAAYTARAEVLSRPDVDASACPNFVFVVEGEVCPCVIVWRSVYVTVTVCTGWVWLVGGAWKLWVRRSHCRQHGLVRGSDAAVEQQQHVDGRRPAMPHVWLAWLRGVGHHGAPPYMTALLCFPSHMCGCVWLLPSGGRRTARPPFRCRRRRCL